VQHIQRVCGFVSLATGETSLYVGCVYMPPVAVAEEEQHHAALMEDILAFQEKGQVVVLGDFNARVGSAAATSTSLAGLGKPTPMPAVDPAPAWHRHVCLEWQGPLHAACLDMLPHV
jgi:endonuclease/exonuclease/phosphatase family metal-dependent hydrolase